MNWIPFTDNHRIRFFDLIMALNSDLFAQLSEYERSLFYHYWHKTVNEHRCWLLEIDGQDLAFVSSPQWQARHWMRWPENILLVSPELHKFPDLPDKIKGESSFRTRVLSEAVTIDQTAYVLNLKNFESVNHDHLNEAIEYLRLGSQHAPEIQALLSEPDENNVPYYRDELKRMITNNNKAQYGFGYYALLRETSLPIAVVFYEAFEMPLTGTPCMLVSDILVKEPYRGQGIATQLQRIAYADMKSKGVNWIIGNIDAGNNPSMKQALKLGRTPWAQQITIAD